MIANYGYQDGSGSYYITVDTDICVGCTDHACVQSCPQDVFAIETDDYDDRVAIVAEVMRGRLRELCGECKDGPRMSGAVNSLPCVNACARGALQHSW